MGSRGSKEERHVTNHTGVPTGHHIRGPGRELRRLPVSKGVSGNGSTDSTRGAKRKILLSFSEATPRTYPTVKRGAACGVWAGAEPRPAGAVKGQCMLPGWPVDAIV